MATDDSLSWWKSRCNKLHHSATACNKDNACTFSSSSGVCLPKEAAKKRYNAMQRFVTKQHKDVADYEEVAITQTVDEWMNKFGCWQATTAKECSSLPGCAYSILDNECWVKDAMDHHLGYISDSKLGSVYRRRQKVQRRQARDRKGMFMQSRLRQHKYKIMGALGTLGAWSILHAPSLKLTLQVIKSVTFDQLWGFMQASWSLISATSSTILPKLFTAKKAAAAASTGRKLTALSPIGRVVERLIFFFKDAKIAFEAAGFMSAAGALLVGTLLGSLSAVFARMGVNSVRGAVSALNSVRATWNVSIRKHRAELQRRRDKLVLQLDRVYAVRARSRGRSRSRKSREIRESREKAERAEKRKHMTRDEKFEQTMKDFNRTMKESDKAHEAHERMHKSVVKTLLRPSSAAWLPFMTEAELNKEVAMLKAQLRRLDNEVMSDGVQIALAVAFCGAIATLTGVVAAGAIGPMVVTVQFVVSVMITLLHAWFADDGEDIVRTMSRIIIVKPIGFLVRLFQWMTKKFAKGMDWVIDPPEIRELETLS